MLVLTRKTQQQIKIGDNITLTIVRVKGQTVRVGIDAPRDIRVVRSELPAEENPAEGASEAAKLEADEAAEGDLPTASVPSQENTAQRPGSEVNRAKSRVIKASSLQRTPSPVITVAKATQPQRKAFSRYELPPLRLAMASSVPAIAK